MIITDETGEVVKDEWMLYTFLARDLIGTPFETTTEGELEWHPVESLQTLPMAEGDRTNLLFAVSQHGNAVWYVLLYGTI